MIELAAAAAKSPSAWDQPGTLAFIVIFAMAVILYFLFRSLAKHLRKINDAARSEAAQAEGRRADGGQVDQVDQVQGQPWAAGPSGPTPSGRA